MPAYLELILKLFHEKTGKDCIEFEQLVNFLDFLWSNYRVALFSSEESLRREIDFLHAANIIEVHDVNGKKLIKLRNLDLIKKLGSFAEHTYISQIDALYRETIDRIKKAINDFVSQLKM